MDEHQENVESMTTQKLSAEFIAECKAATSIDPKILRGPNMIEEIPMHDGKKRCVGIVTHFVGKTKEHLTTAHYGKFMLLPVQNVKGLQIQSKFYPQGHDVDSEHSSMGLVVLNKLDHFHRMKHQRFFKSSKQKRAEANVKEEKKMNEREMLSVKVIIGKKECVGYVDLMTLLKHPEVIRDIQFDKTLYQEQSNVAVHFSTQADQIRFEPRRDDDFLFRLFEKSCAYGQVEIYSSSVSEYEVGTTPKIEGVDPNYQFDDSPCVRIAASSWACLGVLTENMINTQFRARSAAINIVLDVPMTQIFCLAFYAVTQRFAPQSDPPLMLQFAQFLQNAEMLSSAKALCYHSLSIDEPELMERIIHQFDELQVLLDDGLRPIGQWVSDNRQSLKERNLWNGLKDWPIVWNAATN